jgi:hypothetical protein
VETNVCLYQIDVAYVLEYTLQSRLSTFEPDVPPEVIVTRDWSQEICDQGERFTVSNPGNPRGTLSIEFHGGESREALGRAASGISMDSFFPDVLSNVC